MLMSAMSFTRIREVTMNETRFCYTCQVHHPAAQMCKFVTRHGTRWRCRKSIEGANSPAVTRDAFGREQSELKRKAAEQAALRMLNRNLFA